MPNNKHDIAFAVVRDIEDFPYTSAVFAADRFLVAVPEDKSDIITQDRLDGLALNHWAYATTPAQADMAIVVNHHTRRPQAIKHLKMPDDWHV